MKKILTDNFDKLVMLGVFLIILLCYLIFQTPELGTILRDAFLVLTALLGFRRNHQNVTNENVQADTVTISPENPTTIEETKEGEN